MPSTCGAQQVDQTGRAVAANKAADAGGQAPREGHMVGIIVMTHGALAQGIVDAAELITGPAHQVQTLSLRREDNVNDLNDAFVAALEQVDTGDGVLVLTDLMGGSPCNVASMNLRDKDYQLLTGVNLPMFIEALASREDGCSAADLAKACRDSATDGVKHINELLGK